MSMHTLQQILCRGAVDAAFLSSILSAPRQTLQEYDLSPDELALLADGSARSLADLAGAVEAWRRGGPVSVLVRELALAG